MSSEPTPEAEPAMPPPIPPIPPICMNPLFLVRFCLLDYLLSMPVFTSIFYSEMSALDPAENAFMRGYGLDDNPGWKKFACVLATPGAPLVWGLAPAGCKAFDLGSGGLPFVVSFLDGLILLCVI